jgi:ribose transport system substrate-binding protein
MPPALQAVLDGRIVATVRNPSCLIHGGAIIAGVAATAFGENTGMGPGMIPKHIVTEGPVVTKADAPGLVWMEEHFLI